MARIWQLLGYGMRSTAFNLLTYAAAKVDVWLVGEKLSTGQTGIYDRAVHLMGQPITVLGKLGDSVLFSGMASIQDDHVQTRNVTLRAMHFVALLTIPLASALVLQAEGDVVVFGRSFCQCCSCGPNLVCRCCVSFLDQTGGRQPKGPRRSKRGHCNQADLFPVRWHWGVLRA